MIRIGVTGGIGSGKSTVCRLFGEFGVAVYDCDERARELMGTDALRRETLSIFGTTDRSEISRKVFSDRRLLTKLEALVHPAVERDFEAWAKARRAERYVVIESAILFESGFNRLADSVIAVVAPLDVRLARSGFDRDDFLRRVANQMTDEERVDRADYEIDNSVSISELRDKVKVMDQIFRQ